MPAGDGGLGTSLVGEKITMGTRHLQVTRLLGEGGFSYVYLCKEQSETSGLSSSAHANAAKDKEDAPVRRSSGPGSQARPGEKPLVVLKVTSISSRSQRDIAEKEAKLLSRLSHPSIIKMYDTCYRSVASSSTSKRGKDAPNSGKERPQHLILMEFCEGGHALDVCNKLSQSGQRFDLSTLIIAFGQICNAVSYLHAQRPPIVHRDLKPLNFLVKNGAYKLCDFGSAVFGHVDLRTKKARLDAEEVIEKTTTQMFRAPEMVDLYTSKKLTQATDVWALGGCLYSLAFLQNCFEEGSNLAILSRKYTIPDDNPYGEGLVDLLDRMLTIDSKARADMTEVILCLSAVYSGRPLPPRKKSSRSTRSDGQGEDGKKEEKKKEDRIGIFRTDGQGIADNPVYDPTKATEGKKLASNSVAARRKRAAAGTASSLPPTAPTSTASTPAPAPPAASADPMDFSSAFSDFSKGSDDKGSEAAFGSDSGFGDMKGFDTQEGEPAATDFFGSFDNVAATQGSAGGGVNDGFDAVFDSKSGSGDKVPGSEAAAISSQEQAQDAEPAPATSQDAPEPGADPNGDDKKESPDSQRKERSRRRRAGGSSRTTRPTNLETGVEAINIGEGGAAPVDGEKKERRSRASRVDDGEHRRRRSGSRTRRKGRPSARGAGAEAATGDLEKRQPPKKGDSFNRMFNRKPQAPADP